MIKILLTSFLVSFSFIPLFGQVNFGFKAGLNLSTLTNFNSSDNKTKLGLNGGILTEIGLRKKFIVRPEILYSVKGYKFSSQLYYENLSVNLYYISVPLLGGYRLNDKFTILLGPEFSYLTNDKSISDRSNHDISIALDLGTTYNIKNGLGAELRYSYGFQDIADIIITDSSGKIIGKDGISSNRVFQLGLFYKFLKK
ncbi:MAG: PorT family protein [Flavobacterium sp.]|nr:PorT family protein [Pedobacter sp.]